MRFSGWSYYIKRKLRRDYWEMRSFVLGCVRRPEGLVAARGWAGLLQTDIVQPCFHVAMDRHQFLIWVERLLLTASIVLPLCTSCSRPLPWWVHVLCGGDSDRDGGMAHGPLTGQVCSRHLSFAWPWNIFIFLWTLSYVICNNSIIITALFPLKCVGQVK